MFKNFLKIRDRKLSNQKGTALITALLVMGVLTAISLSVSALIVREIGITRLVLDAGKAYYTAESGMEKALLELNKNPMGDFDGEDVPFQVGEGVKGKFTIKNTANSYPVVVGEVQDNPEAYYSYLDVNDSVTIPLFINKGGDEVKVENFVVQYFVDLKKGNFIFNDLGTLGSWDVLRWKVYGIVPDGDNNGETESINDFTPVSLVIDNVGGGKSLTSAANPSWFGSIDNWSGDGEDYYYFTMGDSINYTPYQEGPAWSVSTDVDGQTIYQGYCPRTHAREHYKYDGDLMTVIDCYPISEFLKGHNQNYLVLTNLMNPSVLNSDGCDKACRESKSRLYYRVVSREFMPREFAEITSIGEAGGSKITLDMLRKRDSFMPIFNFALYHSGE